MYIDGIMLYNTGMTIDLKWKIPKPNQLWLKWSSVKHTGSGVIKLVKPIFYGPVLADCTNIESPGQLLLDLTKHFIVLIPQPYEVKVDWSEKITQTTAEATFREMVLLDDKLGLLSILKNRDKILIDCTDHTTERASKGHFKLSFNAMVYNSHDMPYDLTAK